MIKKKGNNLATLIKKIELIIKMEPSHLYNILVLVKNENIRSLQVKLQKLNFNLIEHHDYESLWRNGNIMIYMNPKNFKCTGNLYMSHYDYMDECSTMTEKQWNDILSKLLEKGEEDEQDKGL